MQGPRAQKQQGGGLSWSSVYTEVGSNAGEGMNLPERASWQRAKASRRRCVPE